MAVARPRRYSQTDVDKAVQDAEKRGRESALTDVEDAMAGKRKTDLTLAEVRGMSPDAINAHWDRISELLVEDEAAGEPAEEDE